MGSDDNHTPKRTACLGSILRYANTNKRVAFAVLILCGMTGIYLVDFLRHHLQNPGTDFAAVTINSKYHSKHADKDLRHCPLDNFNEIGADLHEKLFSHLTSWRSPHELNKIPKIIHQSWKVSSEVPDDNKEFVQAWKTLHPEWDYILWGDAENREMIRRLFPWVLDTYNKYGISFQF